MDHFEILLDTRKSSIKTCILTVTGDTDWSLHSLERQGYRIQSDDLHITNNIQDTRNRAKD